MAKTPCSAFTLAACCVLLLAALKYTICCARTPADGHAPKGAVRPDSIEEHLYSLLAPVWLQRHRRGAQADHWRCASSLHGPVQSGWTSDSKHPLCLPFRSVRMPAAEFKRIVSELSSIGDTVVIGVTKDGIKFSTSGDIGSANVTCRQNTSVDKQVVLSSQACTSSRM